MSVSIIVAFAANGLGIGHAGRLPWDIPEDLAHFRELTAGSALIMGRRTYDSIPKAPLPGRATFVATRAVDLLGQDAPGSDDTSVEFCGSMAGALRGARRTGRPVFVAGGADAYAHFLPLADVVYATLVYQDNPHAQCDTFFPAEGLTGFRIAEAGPRLRSARGGCEYQHVEYRRHSGPLAAPLPECAYLDLVRDLLARGSRRGDRTGTGTLSAFGRQVKLDLSRGELPLLTTKAVPYKAVVRELLWFLRGGTDARELARQGVRIWDGNTSRAFLDARGLAHYDEGDIGPMYGFVWRHAGAEYAGCGADYAGQGHDQLAEVLRLLREDPFSRRIVMTTYHVPYLEQGCLHPCHGLVAQFYVDEDAETGQRWLSCHMYQRSQDTFLAWSFNAVGYALLTHVLAAKAGMRARELTISYGDVHLYADHVELAQQQLARAPLPPPLLRLSPAVRDKAWEELALEDFELVGYAHHPRIAARMSV